MMARFPVYWFNHYEDRCKENNLCMNLAATGGHTLPAYLAPLRLWVGITPCPLKNLAGCFHITLVAGLKHLDGGCYHFIVG
jgi:hypothetical protein